VEIARALVFDARVVVMDEPTSSLSQRDVAQLFAVVERLCSRGVAVIYISHFLEEVRRIAQRYTVLRDGASVASGDVPRDSERAPAFDRELLTHMAGRAPGDAYPRVAHSASSALLRVENLRGRPLPQRASFTLHRGEILGIFGLVGAGRTELLRLLFGLATPAEGSIRVGSAALHTRATPHTRWRQRIGMLSENRKEEGLALGLSIAQNLTLSRPPHTLGVVSVAAQAEATQRLGQRLALRLRDPGQRVRELSGGNQQKVALLRLLYHDAEVYLLDEPTRGIDVASKAEIYRLLGELAAQGKAVLVVSSYLPELLGVCDRIAVMNRGELSEARSVHEWTPESLLAAATQSERAQELRA
jgi:ribose transport system ATP-binding protein